MAKVPKKAADRIAAGLRKYQKILASARNRDINESDTVVIIADFLSAVLGFDKYSDITTEYAIRGTYCDLAVKIGGEVKYLIEAKAIGIGLKERHLRQAIGYAAETGIDWVALTNGHVWHVYRMRFEKPVRHDLVFDLDLLSASSRDPDVIEKLFLLSREGISKSAIRQFHLQKDAANPVLVGAVLQSAPVVAVLRRELRRISPGAKLDEDEIVAVLREEVLKREIVEADDARSAGRRVKRASGRSLRKRRPKVAKARAAQLVATSPKDRNLPAPSVHPEGSI